MQALVGIIRSEADLKKGVEQLERLKEAVGRIKVDGNRHYNAAWHQAFDMRNMLVISEAMARAALVRKESRGAHAREDFPEMDKAHFAKVNIVSKKTASGMAVREEPLPDVPEEIKKVLEEKE